MDINKILREAVIDMVETEQLKIKPCPICGRAPMVMSEEMFDRLKSRSDDGHACITIKCENCDLELYDHTHDENDYFIRKFLVTEKWNRRSE